MDDEFIAFARASYVPLVRRAFLMTGDHAQAEDLVQDALVGLLAAWRRTPIEDPARYVARILTNRHISIWRRVRGRELLASIVPDEPVPDESQSVSERDRMLAALRELPRQQRAVLVMRYYEDMPDEEIARLLDITTSTVRSQAARGLQRLGRGGLSHQREGSRS